MRTILMLTVLGMTATAASNWTVGSTVLPDSSSNPPSVSPAPSLAWGSALNGLRCGLEPVAPAARAPGPSTFNIPAEMAFTIHLRNTGEKPLSLLSLSPEEIGMWGPQLFRFEFRDAAGAPVTKCSVQSLDSKLLLHGASAAVLASGKDVSYSAKPATWINSPEFDLQPGQYQVRVRYLGAGPAAEAWSKEAGSSCWKGEIESRWVNLRIAPHARGRPPRLLWGDPVNGLRAAIEFSPDQESYILGQKVSIRLRVQNLSDRPVSFRSTTWRQDDPVTVMDEKGTPSTLTGVWFTGWPLEVRYTLPPGLSVAIDSPDFGFARDHVQANTLQGTVGKTLIGAPGHYALHYTLRFPDIQRTTPAGKPIEAPAGEWTGTLQAGVRDLKVLAGPIYPVFGPVVERTLEPVPAGTVTFLDLNTGKVSIIRRSAGGSGPLGTNKLALPQTILIPYHSEPEELSPQNVMQTMTASGAGNRDSVTPLPHTRKAPADASGTDGIYLFKTAEGRVGVLQVIGGRGGATAMKVRYKLVYEDTAWGTATDGLQGGVRYADGTHPRQVGESVDLDYYLRNASANALTVTYPSSWVLFGGNPPHVTDEQGQPLPVSDGPVLFIHSQSYNLTLKPGETALIGRRSFEVRPVGWRGGQLAAILSAAPGNYRLTQTCSVQMTPSAQGGRAADAPHSVLLRSAELDLRVLPGEPVRGVTQPVAEEPPIVHTGAPVWGPIVNGLQAGLSLDLGERPYAINENVGFTIHVKNVGEKPVRLACVDPFYLEWTPTAADAAGHSIPVQIPASNLPVQMIHRWLAAGETIDIPGVRLGLRSSRADGSNDDPILSAPAGKYRITYSCRFEAQGADEWTGTLLAGPAILNVVAR